MGGTPSDRCCLPPQHLLQPAATCCFCSSAIPSATPPGPSASPSTDLPLSPNPPSPQPQPQTLNPTPNPHPSPPPIKNPPRTQWFPQGWYHPPSWRWLRCTPCRTPWCSHPVARWVRGGCVRGAHSADVEGRGGVGVQRRGRRQGQGRRVCTVGAPLQTLRSIQKATGVM